MPTVYGPEPVYPRRRPKWNRHQSYTLRISPIFLLIFPHTFPGRAQYSPCSLYDTEQKNRRKALFTDVVDRTHHFRRTAENLGLALIIDGPSGVRNDLDTFDGLDIHLGAGSSLDTYILTRERTGIHLRFGSGDQRTVLGRSGQVRNRITGNFQTNILKLEIGTENCCPPSYRHRSYPASTYPARKRSTQKF